MRYIQLILGTLLAALVGSSCTCGSGSGPGEELDPAEARVEDLYGWWTHADEQGTLTVFGFLPGEDAARELSLAPEQVTGPVSAVYQGARDALSRPLQVATFEVKDGELLQTVILDPSAAPGTQFRTRILALTRQRALTLQSSQSASGSRSFGWAPSCQAAQRNGILNVTGQSCENFFSAGTSLAIDEEGGVHGASGINGAPPGCGSVPTFPTYSQLGSACSPALSPLPNFRESAMASEGQTVHFAYESLFAYDSARTAIIYYRQRDLRGEWTADEQVAPQGNPVHEMRLLLRAGQPLILVSRTNGETELYRRDAGAWTRVPTPLLSGGPLEVLMADATLDREGRLVVLDEAQHRLAYERAGGFELLPLPKPMSLGFGGGVAVDASGRVHAAYNYTTVDSNNDGTGGRVVDGRGVYVLYDGASWTTYELGPMSYPRMVTRGDGPWRVVHGLGKAAQPALALTEVDRDGNLRSELLSLGPSFAVGNSPEPYYHTTAVAGPDGSIAASFNGNRILIRPREDERVREQTKLTLNIEGKGGGRVRSADGLIDCTSTCTVEVPVGSRHQLFFEADGRSALANYPCGGNYYTLYGYCWVDVRGTSEATVATVSFRESPVLSVLPLGTSDGHTLVKRLGVRGGRVAFAASLTGQGSTLPIGDKTVDVGAAREVLGVREADGRVWAVPLPAVPAAVGLLGDGSAAALFFAERPTTFPSGTVGSQPAPVLVLAHYANGSFLRLEHVADIPYASTLLAAAVGDDDSAGAVFANFQRFEPMGLPQYNVLVYRDAGGNVGVRGLDSPNYAASALLALESGRAAVVTATLTLYTFNGATPVASRVMSASIPRDLHLGGERVLSVWATDQNSMDLGGGPVRRTGMGVFSAEHGMDARLLSATEVDGLEPTGRYLAIAPAPSGTVFVTSNARQGLVYGRVNDPGYSFSYGGDFAGNKAMPFLHDRDGDSLWVAVRHSGTVDYDRVTLEAPVRPMLVQLKLP
jgi:hypothetical protein